MIDRSIAERRQLALAIAAALFAVLGAALLWTRRRGDDLESAPEDTDVTDEEPELADVTLPG